MPHYHGKNLTSYDLVKTLAIILTVIDHIGYYFYPDTEIFRIIGRACVPIWCFLIGYATTRQISKDIIFWAVVLFASNFVFGGQVLPLGMLFTIMLVRLVLDRAARVMLQGWEPLLYSSVILSILIIPTMPLFEYGTSVLLLALCGVMVRHQKDIPIGVYGQRFFILSMVTIFTLIQIMLFQFSAQGARLCGMLVGGTSLMMVLFRPVELETAKNRFLAFLVLPLQFMGRYTLEIYAVHLLIFKAVAAYYGYQHHGFFAWDWIR